MLKWLPLPTDFTILTFSICFIIFLIEISKKIYIQKDDKKIILVLLLICFMFLLSYIYTISTIYAQSKSLGIILNIFTIIYPIISLKETKFLELRIIFYIVGVIMISILSYLYLMDMFDIFHDSEKFIDKVPTYLVLGLMLSSCFIFSLLSNFSWFVLIYRILILFFLLELGGRGPIINLLFTLLIYFFLFKNSRINKGKINLKNLILIFSFLLLVIFFKDNIFTFFENYNFERFNMLSDNSKDNSVMAREFFLKTGIDSILNHPFFGLGIGSSGIILSGIDEINYPHNLFIEIMMELGVVGGVLYLTLYIIFFIKNYKIVKNNKYLLVLYLLVLLFFLEDNKSNSFDSWRCSIIWIMLFLSEKRYINLFNKSNIVKI